MGRPKLSPATNNPFDFSQLTPSKFRRKCFAWHCSGAWVDVETGAKAGQTPFHDLLVIVVCSISPSRNLTKVRA